MISIIGFVSLAAIVSAFNLDDVVYTLNCGHNKDEVD